MRSGSHLDCEKFDLKYDIDKLVKQSCEKRGIDRQDVYIIDTEIDDSKLKLNVRMGVYDDE